MHIITDEHVIEELVSSRYIERVFPNEEALRDLLYAGKRCLIYIGIDPTSPHLHLGHSTNLLLLKKFQALGHRVIFLIGDFTALVGDPTGKESARKAMSRGEVMENAKGYKEQAGPILDFRSKENPVEIKFNSQWLSVLTLKEVIHLGAKITVGQLIKRDMFQERMKAGKEIYLHEFLYPLLQGYDSVAMDVDIEAGGNDQTFNMLVGRDLMKDYLQKEKVVIATKLLVNPKTQKKLMSKSEGNYIALNDPPLEMYGKIMALGDEVVGEVIRLCTELSNSEIEEIEKQKNPKEKKERLAREIVMLYHGEEETKKAEKEFSRIFSQKKLPDSMPEVMLPKKSISIIDLLLKARLASSKSEARRLVKQGGVRVDEKGITSPDEAIDLTHPRILSKGKRYFIKVVGE
ncbi:MAG: tyrosine--tRNA ligase [Candidatus Colwellbacteria bacterium]|nr:tyrosine--tRNA ligase [Candidatus Colwellbacteria bacterium]